MPLAALVLSVIVQPPPCPPEVRAGYAAAVERARDMGPLAVTGEGQPDGGAALDLPPPAVRGACADVELAYWTVRAWRGARLAAARGGAPESLVGVRDDLERLARVEAGLAGEYARAAVTAAVAAAQDERPEMALYLAHARGIALRLEALGTPAFWPLPIDELEGELWFEVDRYAEGCMAYREALGRVSPARAERIRHILDGPECRPPGTGR
ncbi:MAG: hypothetical protein AB7H88_21810 [Vicinamibacterales bacterium]